MPDPTAIIGLTDSIISIIDLSFKIVSSGKRLYDSGLDTTQELHELNLVLDDVRRKNQDFRQIQTNRSRKLHDDEIQAMKLATESDKVATQLQNILEKLKTRPDRWKITEAGRIAIVSRKRKTEIDELRQRLLMLDSRVRDNTRSALQRYFPFLHFSSPFLSSFNASVGEIIFPCLSNLNLLPILVLEIIFC